MPNCPACGREMKEKKVDGEIIYKCTNCKGVFLPKSIFGVT